MKTFKQWLKDKLFDLLNWLSPTEQPTPGEYEAWALEEAQKPKQPPQVWVDPPMHSYPQTPVLHLPTGQWAKLWREGHKPPVEKQPIAIEEMSPEQIAEVPTIHDLTEDAWLNSGNDPTLTMPAVVKALHQGRHAG